MFEEADISAKILDKINKIKEAIEKIKKLGKDIWDITKPIRDRIVEVFEWLKKLWDRVYPNLKKVWELIEKIWGYETDADINVIWVYISYLRKKLATIGSDLKIKATRNVGYSLEQA